MSPYLTAVFLLAACVLRATTKKVVNFFEEKVHPQEKILATPLTPNDLA